MSQESTERARMPHGTSAVLDARSLQNSYATLLPVLRPGLRVLDVGCGTGAISAGIAAAVGENGHVTGIDSSDHLIAKGKEDHAHVQNLRLLEADLFTFRPAQPFDLIVSARVLQWLGNPYEALLQFKTLLRPGGLVSVLDYNHEAIEWHPAPPVSMQRFYHAFLRWRADAGMDNAIALHLPALFVKAGFENIATQVADEVYRRGEPHFAAKLGIWSIVAASRGKQMVEAGYITDEERLTAIAEYDAWIADEAEMMVMKLADVQGNG